MRLLRSQLEASCLQLSFFAYNYVFELFYLQLELFCLQLEIFRLQWESVSKPLKRNASKEAQL